MPKILFLNQSSGDLFTGLCEDLAKELSPAYSCTLITGKNFDIKVDSTTSLDVFLSFDYNRTSLVSRIISWLLYTVKIFFYCLKNADRDDILFVSSNPPFNNLIGFLVNKIKKNKYLILVYDIYPESALKLTKISDSNIIIRIWTRLNRLALNRASVVCTIGECMAKKLESDLNSLRTKTSSKAILITPPCVNTNIFHPILKQDNVFLKDLNLTDKQIILYAGNFGISHDIESILISCKNLHSRDNIHFLLVGKGSKWKYAFDYKEEHNLDNLTVLPYQPNSVLPSLLASGDISLVSMELEAESLMLPSKTYYSMASGSCIVGICSQSNDLRNIIIKHECGLCVEPSSPKDLTDVLMSILDSPDLLSQFKSNARYASEQFYSRNHQGPKLVNILKDASLI